MLQGEVVGIMTFWLGERTAVRDLSMDNPLPLYQVVVYSVGSATTFCTFQFYKMSQVGMSIETTSKIRSCLGFRE